MRGISGKILALAKKLWYFVLQYVCLTSAWLKKFIKLRLRNHKKCKAQKNMDKVCSRLGAEVYALYRQGEKDWHSLPAVAQQLKAVEEAEARVFQEDELVEAIQSDYLARKQEIIDKYALRRTEAGSEQEFDE